MFQIAISFNYTSRQQTDELLGNLKTAIESVTDETTLKNTVTRINLQISNPPPVAQMKMLRLWTLLKKFFLSTVQNFIMKEKKLI